MDATGAFCHLCECRLTDYSRVVDKRTGSNINGVVKPDAVQNILLTCEICFKSMHRQQIKLQLLSNLLYPDEQLTFSINKKISPFTYEKKEVVRYLDNIPEKIEMVVIDGNTESARQTINLFLLNTAYYDDANNSLRIPLNDYLSAKDLRVQQRTNTWNLAVDFTNRYKQVKESNLSLSQAILEQGRLLAAATGHWSVWATVLWQELSDLNVLSAVLLPQSTSTRAGYSLSSILNRFPGTNPNVFR
jgi:hypothetical protein